MKCQIGGTMPGSDARAKLSGTDHSWDSKTGEIGYAVSRRRSGACSHVPRWPRAGAVFAGQESDFVATLLGRALVFAACADRKRDDAADPDVKPAPSVATQDRPS